MSFLVGPSCFVFSFMRRRRTSIYLFKLLCYLLHEEKKNKHLFAQIHGDLNEIMTFKVGTISMDNG